MRPKLRCYMAFGRALREKRLFKKPCRICGNKKSEGHHHDYRKPLDVDWLCRKHHREEHKRLGNLKGRTTAQRRRISIATRQAMKNPEIRKKCAYWLGKKQSPETIFKRSQKLVGHRSGMLGKKHSLTTKKKMSLASKGRAKTDKHRNAIKKGWILRKIKYGSSGRSAK